MGSGLTDWLLGKREIQKCIWEVFVLKDDMGGEVEGMCRERWLGVLHFLCLCEIQDNVLQLNVHRRKTMRLSYERLVMTVFPRGSYPQSCGKAK